MDPILYDPIPELIPILPEWIRPDPIRYRSLYILFRKGPDHVRSDTGVFSPDTGAHTLAPGVEPILSDPIPEFVHPLPEGTRSCPTRYRPFSLGGALRGSTEKSARGRGLYGEALRKVHGRLKPRWIRKQKTMFLDSLRGSSVKIGTIQRRLAWPLRKDDTHKSRSVIIFSCMGKKLFFGKLESLFYINEKSVLFKWIFKNTGTPYIRGPPFKGGRLGVVESVKKPRKEFVGLMNLKSLCYIKG